MKASICPMDVSGVFLKGLIAMLACRAAIEGRELPIQALFGITACIIVLSILVHYSGSYYGRMVKMIFAVTALITLFSLPAFAAEHSAYCSISGGVWLPGNTTTLDSNFLPVDISYRDGWSVGGAVGFASNKGLRLENEIVYRRAPGKGTTDSQWSLAWLINIWFDMRNSTPITPYLGGGFGYGRGHQADIGVIDGSGNGIAYQAGGGVDIRFSHGLSLDLGYRYFGIADIYNKSAGGLDLSGSSVIAGLRKTF